MRVECFLLREFKERGEPWLPDKYTIDAEKFEQECAENATIYVEEWHDDRVNETSYVVVRPFDDEAKQLPGWNQDDALGPHVIVRVESEVRFAGHATTLQEALAEINP